MIPTFIDGHQLSDAQRRIITECKKRKKACISSRMGSGKTITSLMLAFEISEGKIIYITSITLVPDLESQIKKFFGPDFKYEVLTKISDSYKPRTDCNLIITTPSLLTKCYKNCNISKFFIKSETINISKFLQGEKIIYDIPKNKPFLMIDGTVESESLESLEGSVEGMKYFYKTKFGCIIVDEIQNYTDISTIRCQAIASLCSEYRYLLSGTVFDEPKVERFLGYHLILGDTTFPNNLPDATAYVTNANFPGLSTSLVDFEETEPNETVSFEVIKHLIEHDLTDEEGLIYITMQATLLILQKYIKLFKDSRDRQAALKFNSYILNMLTYIRQSIVCPLIPVANVAIDILDTANKSELAIILNEQFKTLGLEKWLQDPTSIKSSRISKVMEVIKKHKNEKMVLFTSFRTSLDIIEHIINEEIVDENFMIFKINSKMDVDKRAHVLDSFNKFKGTCIMLLTYDLGACGLNLQCASTLLIVDFWWNVSKTNQAVARIARRDQLSSCVNIYFFTSNTGIEKSLFIKQQDKLLILDELKHGPMKSNVSTININEIIKLIEKNENVNLLKKLHMK
jgi:SNF2 family DNA or RNA helicase